MDYIDIVRDDSCSSRNDLNQTIGLSNNGNFNNGFHMQPENCAIENNQQNNEMSNSINPIGVCSKSQDTVSTTFTRVVEKGGKDLNHKLNLSNQLETRMKKQGVILLGRGNSFSLGRSEVILLHHRPIKLAKNRKGKDSELMNNLSQSTDRTLVYPTTNLNAIHEKTDLDETLNSGDCLELKLTSEDFNASNNGNLSPPPISNRQCLIDSEDLRKDSVINLEPCYEDELQLLWRKAEVLMNQKNEKVLSILKDFGIGVSGGGGGDEDECWQDEEMDKIKEEEEVWEIIQDNFSV